jgi:O-acetyl-ADP-ribose deacetylase (regulator of RNase III)
MQRTVKGKIICLVQGDLTDLSVDAIVNAANSHLVLGGGVAGAIRMKGGPTIQEECDRIGGTTVGQAVITGGGKLKARHVIHAVGPRYGEGDEDKKLQNATLNSLRRATENGLKSIAFPAISTGIFGFPIDRCAVIMIEAVRDYLLKEETTLTQVLFCLWTKGDFDLFSNTLKTIIPE